MKNAVKDGKSIDLLAVGAEKLTTELYAAGDNMVYIPAGKIAVGEDGVGLLVGAYQLKAKTTAMVQGDQVSWDNGNKELVPFGDVAEDIIGVGDLMEDSGAGVLTAIVRLKGGAYS